MQTFRTIDVDVEQRVEQVEPCDPERDRTAERPRLPRQTTRDRNPAANGSEPVDRAEPQMAEPGPPLEVRIDYEADHGDRTEPTHDVRELEDGDQVDRERQRAEHDHLSTRQHT